MSGVSAAFGYREFRGLWTTRALSLLGDQVARVALSVLVFDRTHSSALTALAYALTFLPYLAGPLFAGIGDRRPRRSILLAIDAVRALIVGVIAIPGMPLLVVCGLLVLVTAVSPVYDAARGGLLPQLIPDEIYPQGLAAFTVTTEAAQVVGFAVGGVLVAAVGASAALVLDATTFAASFVILATTIRLRPGAMTFRESRREQLVGAVSLVRGSRWLRAMLCLAWLNALWMLPEGIAVPYAASLGGGARTAGLLLAAIPAGAVVGAVSVARWTSYEQRIRLLGPMVLVAAVPLIGAAAHPGVAGVVVLWAMCGVGTAYNVGANAGFVQAVPNSRRSQAIALATTGMVAGQGLAVLIGGIAASYVSPGVVVAAAGVVGTIAGVALLATSLRPRRVIDLVERAIEPAVEEPAPVAV